MPRRSRFVAGFLAALVLTTAGCTVPSVAPNGADEPAPATSGNKATPAGALANWQPCPDLPQQLVGRGASGMSYDCASVAVPRDWAKPVADQTFDVAIIRIRSKTQTNRIGSLLINPGGPGGSGIDTAVYLSYGEAFGGLPTAVTNQFDIIGFDPRGVGRSEPIKCISDADQDTSFAAAPDPVSDADFAAAVTLNKKVADTCGQKYGGQLPLFATEQAAKDMDALRAAVGDAKMSYLGFSYGTLLGATYAQLFPTKVRAMVLDGAVDPKQSYVDGSETQAKGFERAFTNFTAWCQTAAATKCPIAPDARKAVTDAMTAGTVNPVVNGDGRKATSGWIFAAVVSSLYTQKSWPTLANSVYALKQGNAKGIFQLADQYAERKANGAYSNLFDANLAVNCADTKGAPSVDQVRRLQSEWRKKYPLFGGALAVGMLSCSFWPGDRDPYPAGAAVGAPPIVVVGTTGDPATPYENTADLAGMLGVGRVLTWQGEGHTAYPSTKCIVTAVDSYLIDLTVPTAGQTCPAK